MLYVFFGTWTWPCSEKHFRQNKFNSTPRPQMSLNLYFIVIEYVLLNIPCTKKHFKVKQITADDVKALFPLIFIVLLYLNYFLIIFILSHCRLFYHFITIAKCGGFLKRKLCNAVFADSNYPQKNMNHYLIMSCNNAIEYKRNVH